MELLRKLQGLKGLREFRKGLSLAVGGIFVALVLSASFVAPTFAEDDEEVLDGESASPETDYMQLKPTITTNYMSESLKYVRADVAIRVESSMMSDIAMHLDPVRDIIIMLLARQDKETLTSSEGLISVREEAKEEIIAFLESEGEPTDVVDVLFLSFLVE